MTGAAAPCPRPPDPRACPACGADDFEKRHIAIGGRRLEAHQCRACGWPRRRKDPDDGR